MNRLKELFHNKNNDILNIYFTAGFPELQDTEKIIKELDDVGVDLIELGMPYSDPLADGETIQRSSSKALKNGLQLDLLFQQIKNARKSTDIPIMLMGYYNQILQYGPEKFFDKCNESQIDGLIIPDVPMDYYANHLQEELERREIMMTFLITPETSDERIKQADTLSSAFLYVVSKSSITGGVNNVTSKQENYFNRLNQLNLKAPRLIGFGIHDRDTFIKASRNANGAIIGSAFIRMLEQEGIQGIKKFINDIRPIN